MEKYKTKRVEVEVVSFRSLKFLSHQVVSFRSLKFLSQLWVSTKPRNKIVERNVGKSGFTSHTKHTAEATIMNLLHS